MYDYLNEYVAIKTYEGCDYKGRLIGFERDHWMQRWIVLDTNCGKVKILISAIDTIDPMVELTFTKPNNESKKMSPDRFKELLDELDGNSLQTLKEKNARYSTDRDCLHNFRSGAEIMDGTPAQACWGYMTKHLVALRDMVEKNDFSNRDDFLEKCQDTINYIRFLWCIGNDKVNVYEDKNTEYKANDLMEIKVYEKDAPNLVPVAVYVTDHEPFLSFYGRYFSIEDCDTNAFKSYSLKKYFWTKTTGLLESEEKESK